VKPLLANVEANLTVRPTSYLAMKGFVGLNYDSRVPGVAAPVIVTIPFPGTQQIPASIKFEEETSWYAGGGLTVRFGP